MRKALRIALRVLLGLIATVVILVAGVVVAIQFKPVRDFARDKGLAAIRGSLKGELALDDIRWPRLDRIEIYGVELKDRRGVRVLAASGLIVNLKLRPLLGGKVVVERFDADHLYVDLADFGDQTGLLSVFASDAPKPPPKPQDKSDTGLSPVDVRIRSLCLQEGEVRLQPQPARSIDLRRINTCLELGIGRSLELTLADFAAELRQNDKPVLVLAKPSELPPLVAAAPLPPPSVAPPEPAPILKPAANPEPEPKPRSKGEQRRAQADAKRRAAQEEKRAAAEAKRREPVPAAPVIVPARTPSLPNPAGPMRVSLAGKVRFRTDYDLGADLRMQVRGFSADTLKALNIDASTLKPGQAIDLDLHTGAVGQRINYRLDVRAPDSVVQVSGELNAQRVLFTHVVSDRLELSRFTSLELPRLSFELDSQLDLSDPAKELRAQLNLVRGGYGELELPQVSIQARRRGDGLTTLRSLEARYGGALLSASGTLAADGGIKAEAKLKVPELGALPPVRSAGLALHGALSADVRLGLTASAPVPQASVAGRAYPPASATPPGRSPGPTRQPAAAETGLDAEVNVNAHDLALQDNKLRSLALAIKATGSLDRPILLATLNARDLVAGGQTLAQTDVTVDGGPDRYRISAQVDARRLSLEGWFLRDAPAWEAGLQLSSDIADAPATAEIPLVRFVPGSGVEVRQLRARLLDATLFADGTVGLGDANASKLRFGASVPDVAVLTRKFGGSEVPGRVELAGSVRGEIAKPSVDMRVRYMNGPPLGRQPSQLDLHALADLKRGRAQVDLNARAGSAKAQVKLQSKWQHSLPLGAALTAADHDLEVDLSGLSLAALTQPADPDMRSRFDGWLTGHLSVKGNQRKLKLDSNFNASRVRMVGDPTSLDVALGAKYADSRFDVEVQAGDRRGQFGKMTFDTAIDVERMIAQPPAQPKELIKTAQWAASAEFAERMVRELPIVSGGDMGRELSPLTVATHAKIDHAPGAEPVGELESKLRWKAQGQLDAWSSCSERASGEVTLTGKLQDGQLGLEVKGGTRKLDAVGIALGMSARMGELLAGTYGGLGPLKLSANIKKLDLASLPMVCERGVGTVSLDIAGQDLFNQLAKFQLEVEARGVQWDLSPPLDVVAHGRAEANTLNVDAELTSGSGKLRIDGQLPVGFQTKDPALVVNRGGPVVIKTNFKHVDVASLLAFVPAVARVSGTIDGAIDVAGKLQEPTSKGTLQLNDVSLTLPRLGQRFSHVYLKAILDGRRLRLQDVKLKDLDGSASLAAALNLESVDKWDAELNLRARNFPLRKSGVMMGRCDVDANVTAKSTQKDTTAEIRLKNTAINLTTQEIASVQTLDPNPEIVFTDGPPASQEEEEPEPATGPPPHVQINVITDEPVWIRRDDFAVQMSAAIYVAIGGDSPSLTGQIDLVRGYINLLGQSFDIKTGKVVLTGGLTIDPQIEITASHETPQGQVVKVEVTGFVHAPELHFTVDGRDVEAAVAITKITGLGGDSSGGGADSMESQLTSAAIGMTTGLLTLGARREFGDWIPKLSFETGDQTRVRVGFEADKLIPNFMRGFVKGAYVEGIVASENTNKQSTTSGGQTNSAAGGGVLLELMLPKNFVWAGQYGPGTVWSVDLDYRP